MKNLPTAGFLITTLLILLATACAATSATTPQPNTATPPPPATAVPMPTPTNTIPPQPTPTQAATPTQAPPFSQEEEACIDQLAQDYANQEDSIIQAIESGNFTPTVLNCISDQKLAKLALTTSLKKSPEISDETTNCLVDHGLAQVAREIYSNQTNLEERATTGFIITASTVMTAALCLNDKDWETMGMTAPDRETMTCLFHEGATATEFTRAYIALDMAELHRFELITEECAKRHQPDQNTPAEEEEKPLQPDPTHFTTALQLPKLQGHDPSGTTLTKPENKT